MNGWMIVKEARDLHHRIMNSRKISKNQEEKDKRKNSEKKILLHLQQIINNHTKIQAKKNKKYGHLLHIFYCINQH